MKYVQWDLTAMCNLKCAHCREQVTNHYKDELTLEECKNLIDQMLDFDVDMFSITGGEPILSPNFREVIKYSYKKFNHICVGTNATLITSEWADFFKTYNITMQVSLEGHNFEINDIIRGAGSFDKIIKGISILKQSDVDTYVRTTVNEYNKNNIRDVMSLVKGLKINSMHLRRTIPTGNAKNIKCLTANELRDIVSQTIEYGEVIKMKLDWGEVFCKDMNEKPQKNIFGGCGIGVNTMYIMQNGTLAFCPYLPIFCGSIRNQSLKEIWENSKTFKVARSIRFNLKGKCGSCDYKQICGGCRAYAYAVTKDMLAEDPGCWH